MKRTFLLILLLVLGSISVSMAQRRMKLTLRYDATVKRYSVLAKCDFTESRFLWGPSQITIVLPSNGRVKKLQVLSISGGSWSDESTVYHPQAQPENDFHGMDTRGGEVFNIMTDKELVVFYFTLPANIDPKEVHLFVNGKDPNSIQPGMMGGDFWNTIVDRTGEDIFTGLYTIDSEGIEEFIPSVPPVTTTPVTTTPVTTTPVTTTPVTTTPVTTTPVTTTPVTTTPVTTTPVTITPVTITPVTTTPVTTTPVTITPVTITPVTITPVTITPVTITPVTITPVTITPVTITPVTITPVTITPVTITPVTITPVTTTPVTTTPVTITPVTTTPVTITPVTNTFVMNVYPNVVTDYQFRVLVWGNNILPDEELLVTVVDDTGKEIMSTEGTNRSLARKRLKLPLNTSGKILTVRVVSKNGTVTKRIIVN